MSILYHVNTVVALKLWFSKLQAEFLQLPLNYSFEKKKQFQKYSDFSISWKTAHFDNQGLRRTATIFCKKKIFKASTNRHLNKWIIYEHCFKKSLKWIKLRLQKTVYKSTSVKLLKSISSKAMCAIHCDFKENKWHYKSRTKRVDYYLLKRLVIHTVCQWKPVLVYMCVCSHIMFLTPGGQ